jgi:uncharacterized membrane protein (UPF0136 family)
MVYAMALFYGMVALIGGLISSVLLWPYGANVALLSMPFCGSLLALIAAILIDWRGSDQTNSGANRANYIAHSQEPQTTENQ